MDIYRSCLKVTHFWEFGRTQNVSLFSTTVNFEPCWKLKSEHGHKMKCLVRYNRKSFYTLSLQKSSNYSQLFHKRFHCEPMVNRL